MRKLYSILVWTLLLVAGACSDDDDNNAVINSLKVVTSDVKFTCTGGSGTIEVSSASPIEVKSTAEWCKADKAGNVITVTVEENRGLSSRTALVIIQSATEKAEVPVTQMGDIFDTDISDYEFPDEGGSVTFKMKSNWNIEVKELDESWLSYKLEDDKITFTATPLTEGGKYKENSFTVLSGNHQLNLTFTQFNLAGEYQMLYTYNKQRVEASCRIEKTNTADLYTFKPEGALFNSPFNVKYRKGELVITFGQFLEVDNQGRYIYLCAFDPAGRLTWSTGVEYVASIKELKDGKMILTFKDNGTWANQKVGGFYYAIADKLVEDGGKISGNGWSALDIVLIKK